MKKWIALLMALMLLAAPALAQEAPDAPAEAQTSAQQTEAEPIDPMEQAEYRAQLAQDAQPLVAIMAASVNEAGFDGAPNAQTAWSAMGLYAALTAQDGQVFTEAQMEEMYAALFAQGQFAQIADEVGGSFLQVEAGYAFQMADGDPTYQVIGGSTDNYTEDTLSYDVSLYTLGHDEYPMTFAGNAVAVLSPNEQAAFGAQVAGWMPQELPSFPQAQSSAQLGDQEGNSYAAANAIDGKLETCWAYPLAGSQDPALTLSASQPQQVRGLVITPGYAKSRYAFTSNRRVARLTATLDDGTQFSWDLADVDREAYEGTYVLPFGGAYEAQSVTIRVEDTYEGTHFDDVCISEVYLF